MGYEKRQGIPNGYWGRKNVKIVTMPKNLQAKFTMLRNLEEFEKNLSVLFVMFVAFAYRDWPWRAILGKWSNKKLLIKYSPTVT